MILDDVVFCLSGHIDNAPDDGIGFRRNFISLMNKVGVKANYFDPTNKPTGGFCEIGAEKQHSLKLRAERKFEELRKIVYDFRRQDLRGVDLCEVFVAYIDPDIPTAGTYDEIYTAEDQHKPRYLVVEGGLERCPLWLFDVFNLDDMFDTVEDCVKRFELINKGEHPLDSRWVFRRNLIK